MTDQLSPQCAEHGRYIEKIQHLCDDLKDMTASFKELISTFRTLNEKLTVIETDNKWYKKQINAIWALVVFLFAGIGAIAIKIVYFTK